MENMLIFTPRKNQIDVFSTQLSHLKNSSHSSRKSLHIGLILRTRVSDCDFFTMEVIPISKGLFTTVDDADYEWLNQWKWYAHKGSKTFYACRRFEEKHQNKAIMMHRQILGLTDPKILCDHRDHNGLNNERSNLRLATYSQNQQNTTSRRGSTSKYLGVSFFNRIRASGDYYWVAAIRLKGKVHHLGYFKIEEDAARAYDDAAKNLFGEFANLNFK